MGTFRFVAMYLCILIRDGPLLEYVISSTRRPTVEISSLIEKFALLQNIFVQRQSLTVLTQKLRELKPMNQSVSLAKIKFSQVVWDKSQLWTTLMCNSYVVHTGEILLSMVGSLVRISANSPQQGKNVEYYKPFNPIWNTTKGNRKKHQTLAISIFQEIKAAKSMKCSEQYFKTSWIAAV